VVVPLARQNMINNQIRPQRVRDLRLLKAFTEIDRTLFLLPSLQPIAYSDRDLIYHQQRFLMAPMIFAQLVESAHIQPHHRVLVVGCGTGYSLAILSFLCANVTGLESISALAQQAQQNINSLNILNVTIANGPLIDGTPEALPYDVILIEGAVYDIPSSLTKQLKNGGCLVTIKRNTQNPYILGKGVVVSRYDDSLTCIEGFDAGTKPLPEFISDETFTF
jgi:protein-L-isoaspartate(D-aspartate) O-methyltransferase